MAVCFNYFLSIAIFLNIDISQGSVATRLRCGGIFKYGLVANLPVSLPVKEFWKSVNISGSCGQEFGVLFFSETQVVNTVVIHRMLTLISYANLQCIGAWSCHSSNIQTWWTVHRRRVLRSIMTNVTWRRFDQSAKQLTVGHTTIWNLNSWSAFGIVINVIQIVRRFAVFQFNDFNKSAARHFKF